MERPKLTPLPGEPTTSRGVCRKCRFSWKVPAGSPIGPRRLVRMQTVSFYPHLPPACPACRSVEISYLCDQTLTARRTQQLNRELAPGSGPA